MLRTPVPGKRFRLLPQPTLPVNGHRLPPLRLAATIVEFPTATLQSFPATSQPGQRFVEGIVFPEPRFRRGQSLQRRF